MGGKRGFTLERKNIKKNCLKTSAQKNIHTDKDKVVGEF
jgi:hypothetical protein